MTRYLHLLEILCVLTASTTAVAQTDVKPAVPATMLSYLDAEMRVGIKSVEGTASVLLYVYTEDDYETALSINKFGLDPINNSVVKHEVDAFMERNGLVDASKGQVMVVPPRQIYGRIEAVGDDYLLIGLEVDTNSEPKGKSQRRRIIPKSSIGSIDLDASPVRFIIRPQQPSPETADN